MNAGVYILVGILGLSMLGFGIWAVREITNSDKRHLSTDDFAGCMAILNAIIQVEFDLYNNDIFNKKEAITNTNFDNFYNDLTHRIIHNVPDNFINRMSSYYTTDAIYTYIARRCKMFLSEKINGTM